MLQGEGSFRPLAGTNPHIGEVGAFTTVTENRLEILFESHRQAALLKALFASHPYEEVAYDIYSLDNQQQDVGSGRLGILPQPMETMAFLQQLKNTFGGGLRYTTPVNKAVQKIAVCGGSGSFLLEAAVAAGADVLVTADFKYHQFLEADNRILIADIGHFESEQFTITLLTNYLRENFINFATLSTETKTNPVNYL
jgi:putative NIF3 family GTP cyclohydrolase 1 type 2